MAQCVYEDTLMERNISPTRIYNVDTKDVCTNWKKTGDLLTSAGRGIHMTAVCRMNPYGHYITPAFIFPCKNWKNELIDSATLGALGIAHDPRWMMVRYCWNG
jgi:hypothetical protein